MKKEIELETKNKENATVNNAELERSVRAMEKNVMQLESGNLEADDSEIKQKFDNQRQLNVQLQEQKRWLEHELEQVGWDCTIYWFENRLYLVLIKKRISIKPRYQTFSDQA